MKHFYLFLLVLFTVSLSACGPQPSLSLSEMETTYETSLLSALPLSLLDESKDEEHSLKTQTDVSATLLSASNKLQGNLSYASTNYTQDDEEQSHLTFDLHLQDNDNPIPIFMSGTLDTLYLDQTFYFTIQDFLLSIGEGNAEVNFINLLAQQLAHKRVALDESERFGISVVETPDLSSLLYQLFQLFTSQQLDADFSDSSPASLITGTIISLDEEYLATAQTFYQLLIQLVGLPLEVEELSFDSSTPENVIGYTVIKNNQVTHTKTIKYRSLSHTFTTTLTFSPKELKIEVFDIRPLDATQPGSDMSLIVVLQPRDAQLYTLTMSQLQGKELVGNLSTNIIFLPTDDGLGITFDGEVQLLSFPPFSTEPLSLMFEIKQFLQTSPLLFFDLTGDVIKLSELL